MPMWEGVTLTPGNQREHRSKANWETTSNKIVNLEKTKKKTCNKHQTDEIKGYRKEAQNMNASMHNSQPN